MRHIALVLAPAIVLAALAAAGAAETAASPPVKIVVFPFELEDFSAGAAYVPPDDIDREQLRLSTEEARRLIAASGRYQLVDVSAVNDAGGEGRKVAGLRRLRSQDRRRPRRRSVDDRDRHAHHPNGIRGHLTGFATPDPGRSSTVKQTDLRMGANVAWSRGARWLIENRLLEQAK